MPESEARPPAARRLPQGVSLALDAIRFAAALTVFASHMAWRFFTGAFLWPMEPYGAQAVVVFFVLSGYVIAHVAATSEMEWRPFAAARLARLWSVALPALALTFALDAIGRSVDPARYHALVQYVWTGRLHQALSGAFFLNETWGSQAYVGTALPYWSLGYEAWYYAIFALAWYPRGAWRLLALAAALAAGPRIMVMAPLWALGFALYHATAGRPPPRALALPLAVAGLLLWGGWIALAGKLADIPRLGAWFDRPTLLQDYVVATAFALVLLGIVAGTNSSRAHAREPGAPDSLPRRRHLLPLPRARAADDVPAQRPALAEDRFAYATRPFNWRPAGGPRLRPCDGAPEGYVAPRRRAMARTSLLARNDQDATLTSTESRIRRERSMTTSIISGNITAPITLTSAYYADPVTNSGTITLATGGTVAGIGAATSWSVVNTGAILVPSGTATYGISLGAGGSISNAAGAAIQAGRAAGIFGGAGTITNYGLLAGSTYGGAVLGKGGLVSNASGGTISGVTHAILIKNAAGTVINSGTIGDTTKAAIVLQLGGSVTNNSTGVIREANTGIYVTGASGAVVNSGYMYASSGHSVELDSGGSVTNASGGTILGQHAQIYSASTLAAGVVTLTNSGFIGASATTSSVVALLASGGTVSNLLGGTISGGGPGVVFKNGIGSVDNAGLITSGQGGGLALLGGGTVVNEAGGRILGAGSTASAIYVTNGSGIVVNHGMIDAATRTGIAMFSGGIVQNYGSGTIIGQTDGIFIKGGAGTVQSRGTIIGHGGTAVALAAGYANRVDVNGGAYFGGVVNGGNTIGAAFESTLRLQYYSAAPTGTLTNLNTSFVNFQQILVKGAWIFDGSDSLLAGVTLTNQGAGTGSPAGTIEGAGVTLGAGDLVVNDTGAVITHASTAAKYTAGVYGGSAATNVTVVNYGLIANPTNTNSAGVALFAGGTVTNSGTIVGYNVGIYSGTFGGILNLVNSGLLQGNYDSGIDVKSGGIVTNLAHGTITAPKAGINVETTATVANYGLVIGTNGTAEAISLGAGGSVFNAGSGTIAGAFGIYQGGTSAGAVNIIEAGTISASSAAIKLQSGANDVITIEPGAYIHGLIDGGNGLASGFTTSMIFAPGHGAFNVSVAPLIHVNQVTVDAGGYWTLSGTTPTLVAGAVIDDLGAMTLASGLAGSGDIFMGQNATLAFAPVSAPSPVISGFTSHETIEILGASATGLTLSGSQLTVAGTGVTLNVNTALPAGDFGFALSNGNTYITACFATGTAIVTDTAPRPVETLREGERVVTATGRLAVIKWIGHRRIGSASPSAAARRDAGARARRAPSARPAAARPGALARPRGVRRWRAGADPLPRQRRHDRAGRREPRHLLARGAGRRTT